MLEEITGDGVNRRTPVASRAVPALPIEVTQLDGRMCVRVYGELDAVSAPSLGNQLAELTAELVGDLVLDISGLSFVDSIGLSLFVTLHQNLESKGAQLILLGPTPMARRILEISALDSVLHIEPALRETGSGAAASDV